MQIGSFNKHRQPGNRLVSPLRGARVHAHAHTPPLPNTHLPDSSNKGKNTNKMCLRNQHRPSLFYAFGQNVSSPRDNMGVQSGIQFQGCDTTHRWQSWALGPGLRLPFKKGSVLVVFKIRLSFGAMTQTQDLSPSSPCRLCHKICMLDALCQVATLNC